MAQSGSEVEVPAGGSIWASEAAARPTEPQVTEGRQWPWETDENSERKSARLACLRLCTVLTRFYFYFQNATPTKILRK